MLGGRIADLHSLMSKVGIGEVASTAFIVFYRLILSRLAV